MPKNHWERAEDGSANMHHKNKQSSDDFNRSARQSHSQFKLTNESNLGSGKSQTPEPAQAGGGSLELLSMTMAGVVTTLGALAAAAVIHRNHR
ncbi:MAG: hypothetical protein JWP06_414 [Candidatus Saccharibacteria bacterium]|nr:hypothetical protein [Candidatus Saccharibacteria bacterium]